MPSQTEDLLWIASQEDRLIPHDIVVFAKENNKTLSELLLMNESDFDGFGIDENCIKEFFANVKNINNPKYNQIFEHMQENNIGMLRYTDELFPAELKRLSKKGSSVMLYHQGMKINFENCIAVVGTRNCSTYAAEFTREISRHLAKQGHVIVAGLARGIDAVAHRGAISANGKTIAVLPWIYDPYPPEHKQLMLEIEKHGCVISENFYKSQQYNNKYKFLERNAVISGISDVLIAVESSITGGTSWQVDWAIEQGKTVIAVKPEEDNIHALEGFNKFVTKGALQAKKPSDVYEIVRKNAPFKEHTLTEFDFEKASKEKFRTFSTLHEEEIDE